MDKQKLNHSLNGVSLSFLTPYYQQGRGNSTTAKRIVTGLIENQMKTNVIAYDEECFSDEFVYSSDLLHVLHFRRFADWLENNRITINRPFVITSGGTDVNIDIFNRDLQEKIGAVLEKAAAITVFNEDAKQKLLNVYDNLDEKIYIINQSVWFPATVKGSVKSSVRLPKGGRNILLPAGLRAVKDVLFVLPALVKLKKQFPNLTFTIIGASLDRSILKAVQQKIEKYDWLNYYEEVRLEEMESIYKQSEIVINTSLSEGQSSALLEAMYMGKPVVARNNGGNRSIIRPGKTGFLFDNEVDFYHHVHRLLTDQNLKETICNEAKDYVLEAHSLQKEVKSYISLYQKIIYDYKTSTCTCERR